MIKSCGKFEEHRQFLDGVGTEIIVEAIDSTLVGVVERGESIEETKEGAIRFFNKVMKEHNINIYPDLSSETSSPSSNPRTPPATSTSAQPSIEEHDDMRTYASDFASRTLLSLVMRHAERKGDFDTILALKIVLVSFFFNASGMNSQYAPTLMFDVVDYLGASSATRRRLEVMVTANLSGKAGHNIHVDKMCEHFIRKVKNILRNLHRGFSESLLNTTIAASNTLRSDLSNYLKPLSCRVVSCRVVSGLSGLSGLSVCLSTGYVPGGKGSASLSFYTLPCGAIGSYSTDHVPGETGSALLHLCPLSCGAIGSYSTSHKYHKYNPPHFDTETNPLYHSTYYLLDLVRNRLGEVVFTW